MKQKARCPKCGRKVFVSKGRLVEHNDQKAGASCGGSLGEVSPMTKK